MQINSLQSVLAGLRLRRPEAAPDPLAPAQGPSATDRADLLRARSRLLDLFRALQEIDSLTSGTSRLQLDLPDARSSPALSLDLSRTAARLDSTEEVNTTPTSFSPFGPAWTSLSTAELTIGGVYDGSSGTGTFTFEARGTGIHGIDRLRIRVYDPAGAVYTDIQVRETDPLEQQYELGNGLFFTLGPGALFVNETALVDVYDAIGSAVDPALPLGGVRNQDPNLEFGSPAVVDGAFEINGVSIAVSTTDSINDVIARINASGAGVTAAFDAASERIRFMQNTPGSAPTIVLSGDTSNFFAATKLDGATVLAGTDPEPDRSLASVADFSSVASGSLLINGTAVAIDRDADSLNDVIARINAADTGATARFDSATGQVVIEAATGKDFLELDGNGTGFFSAVNIVEGRVDTAAVSGGISRRRSYQITDSVERMFGELNELFRDQTFGGEIRNASLFRGPLSGTLGNFFDGEGERLLETFGLALNTAGRAQRDGTYASLDRAEFARNLQRRGEDVRRLLFGGRDGGGLVQELAAATRRAIGSVNQLLGVSTDALIDESV